MAPLPLTLLLENALPGLSRTGRAVVGVLGCFNGKPQSPTQVASLVGLRTRFQLARALRREGLPPLQELAAWTRVLYWLQQAERTGQSLLRLAKVTGIDPAIAYRLVHRTTGLRWLEARGLGLAAVVRRFRVRYHARKQRGPLPGPWRAPPLREEGDVEAGQWSAGSAAHGPPSHPRGVLSERLLLAGYPFDVVVTPGGDAWLTRCHAACLDHIGLEPLSRRASVATGATPSRIAVAPSGERAYVTNQFTSEVAVIDLRERRRLGAIPVTGNPLAAVLSLDGQTLYVTTNLDLLLAVSLATGQIARSIPIPMACTSLLLHPAGTRLFVPTFRAGTILEVDARTLKPLASYRLGGVVHELTCTPDGLRLYATNEDGWLDAIQLTTGRHESLQFGTAPHGLALSPDGAILFVGLLRAGEIAVVDRQTLTRLSTIQTGGKPRRIAFDVTGRRAVIANESGWVDLVT